MDVLEDQHYDESETDAEFSDDSTNDPTFDPLDETRLTFSNLSIEREIKRRVVKRTDEKEGGDSTVTEMFEPELDEQGQKSYETIQKIIEGLFDGHLEKLKVEECKIYLRRHVLRLSGTKDVLIQRIKEHVDIVNGGGEKKYPASSFLLNCKGDACMGDVVMFEQYMYDMFKIASRSANGPPCGTRVVAGRIVKESYGTAKQQHTFTIEVLWSKGEKRLPPLHPLLIKGRNLYRLKTMRQKWDDEGERQKILSEKHARGGVARCNREARIQQREMRKIHKQNRATRKQRPNRKQEEEKQDPLHSVSVKPENLTIQAKQRQQDPKNSQKRQSSKQKINSYPRTCGLNIPIQLNSISKAHVPLEGHLRRQPLISMNCSFPRDQHINSKFSNFDSLRSTQGGFHEEQHINYNRMRKTLCGFDENRHRRQSQQSHLYHRQDLNAARNPAFQQKQTCRYYVQGRCHFGDRCKYLHELARNGV